MGDKWKNILLFLKQFHDNFLSKTPRFQETKSFFRDARWCFNASWGYKGLLCKKEGNLDKAVFLRSTILLCKAKRQYLITQLLALQNRIYITSFHSTQMTLLGRVTVVEWIIIRIKDYNISWPNLPCCQRLRTTLTFWCNQHNTMLSSRVLYGPFHTWSTICIPSVSGCGLQYAIRHNVWFNLYKKAVTLKNNFFPKLFANLSIFKRLQFWPLWLVAGLHDAVGSQVSF